MSRSLPTGVVTFLLTDIEGSTHAWQSAPAGLAASIQTHYDLLDRSITAHGGVRPEEQGEGDSVVAVFPDPVEAVAAAVEAQRLLLAELPDLPVRMALHTGEANLRDERNYVGLTVIRCARIRSCGHGGQILVSAATVEAVGDRLPPGCSTRVLGEYGLKGLTGRTQIAQVEGPGLPGDFPALRAGASAAGNLPHRVSSFVGRRAELAELTALVGANRLVSVVGDAGVGKSRLALAAAMATADAHPGGAWWVSLSDRAGADVDEVASAVAAGCSIDRRDGALDDVADFFGRVATSILVLDGVDGIVPATTGFVERLLATCPDLRIVVTACEPLAVGGEVAARLDAYPPPTAATVDEFARTSAGQLFLTRLRDAGGSLRDADVPAAVRICERWSAAADIEMAAIRAAQASPAELLRELDELGGAATTALSSSMHWHLRSLGDDERSVLRRLALFRRSIDPDDALAVVTGPDLPADRAAAALRVLTERRVVQVDGERLVLGERLLEVVSSWPPVDDDTVDRYVDRFAGVAERFESAGVAVSPAWLDDDLDDVLGAVEIATRREMPAAFRLVRALAPRWHELGRWDELAATARWLAGRSPTDGELAWVAAVSRLVFACAGVPDADVHELADEAVAVAALDHDDLSAAYLSFRAAAASLDAGDHEPAAELFEWASALGAEPLAAALAARLAVAVDPARPAWSNYLAVRADGGHDRDPIAAARSTVGVGCENGSR